MPSNTDISPFVNSKRMRTSDGVPDTAVPFSLFPSLYSSLRYFWDFPRSHVELLDVDRLCEVRSTAVISIHFAGILMLGAESDGDEQRAGEESDNLFSRVSRRCSAVTRQVFSFIVRIGEAFFLPAGPWDQTGFHRRGAVTEYTPIPKPRSPSRGGAFRAREMYFSKIDLPKERIHFASTQRFVTHFAVAD